MPSKPRDTGLLNQVLDGFRARWASALPDDEARASLDRFIGAHRKTVVRKVEAEVASVLLEIAAVSLRALKAELLKLGPEPHKPSPERRFFGSQGKAGARPEVRDRYDAEVKAYSRWRRRHQDLYRQQVELSNEQLALERVLAAARPDNDDADDDGLVIFVSLSGEPKARRTRLEAKGDRAVQWAQGRFTLDVPWSLGMEGNPSVELSGWSAAGWQEIKRDLPPGTRFLFMQGSPGTWDFDDEPTPVTSVTRKGLASPSPSGESAGVKYALVEKEDHRAVHGLFDDRARAERHLRETVPLNVARGYYDNKDLTALSFEIIEKPTRRKERRGKDSSAAKTVTVRRKGKRYLLSFSALPGQTFGPYDFDEAVRDLRVSALLSPMDARDLVLDAASSGESTRDVG